MSLWLLGCRQRLQSTVMRQNSINYHETVDVYENNQHMELTQRSPVKYV